ncbi:uncharacterized protein [Choristoneura fumiferana]|uniref:uncharacterized protein n=1 Tax=Choristoneura fumiferana TaxID=7141 RepID=UPI003D15E912
MKINVVHIVCILNLLWRSSESSIAGVTYMDHFDFEERYRHVHECDPFYWHPLHLPEDCADMYEKLIRSKIPKNGAFRVLKERRPVYVDDSFSSDGDYQIPYNFEYTGNFHFYTPSFPSFPYPIKPVRGFRMNREMTPYEKMLASVRRDVSNQPSYPTIQVMPNLGPVALYYQPISKKSESMIKKLSRTYGGAAREAPVYKRDPYDQEGKKNRKEDINKNKWKDVVNKVLKKGWKKTEKGRFVTLSKTKPKH